MTLIRKIKRKIFGNRVPSKSKSELKKKGDDKIFNLFVVRRPIESYVNKLLKIVTLDQIDSVVKKAGVRDKLLHIFLVINGFIYELNEQLELGTKRYTKMEDDEYIKLDAPDKTVNEFIEKAQSTMGDKFYNYDPFKNNCGDWVKAVLRSNGIMTNEINTFINQNASQIGKKLGWSSEVVEAITDLGSLVASVRDTFNV